MLVLPCVGRVPAAFGHRPDVSETRRTFLLHLIPRGFRMLLATSSIPWSVRESSPPYGTSPERSPAEVARELVDAWQALARAESAVALAEGDTLRLLADQRLYLRLGFSGFHDFCVEAAEMTASTAKRRVAVSRLAAEVPALRD